MNLRFNLYQRQVLKEVFINQSYNWLYNKIKPNTVLFDFGAFIGETAIYFAQNPYVKRVFAYEPNFRYFNEAIDNIDKSLFFDKISPFGLEASLSYISSKFKNVAIKCDIEGAETGLFSNSKFIDLDKVLKNVYAIQLEYHNTDEYMNKIFKSLGYKTKIVDAHKGAIFERVGYIYAWK